MEFFKGLSFGYQVMLVGIGVFIIGVIVMLIENRTKKRSPEEIKNEYMVKNNVRSSDNPAIKNENSLSVNTNNTVNGELQKPTNNEYPKMSEHNELNINPPSNNTPNNSDLMNMYK